MLCKNTLLRLLGGFVAALVKKESQSHHCELACFFFPLQHKVLLLEAPLKKSLSLILKKNN